MKLHKLTCPNCNGSLDMKVSDDTTSVFCPYCGQNFWLEDGKTQHTIIKNIHKTTHVTHIDEAKILKEQIRDKQHRREMLIPFVALILAIMVFAIPALISSCEIDQQISDGKICAGNSEELIGEDYRTVEAHFKAAGFTNIELIDLDDSGIAFWTEGEVQMISIGGDTSFSSMDYFDPDTKVVISYH